MCLSRLGSVALPGRVRRWVPRRGRSGVAEPRFPPSGGHEAPGEKASCCPVLRGGGAIRVAPPQICRFVDRVPAGLLSPHGGLFFLQAHSGRRKDPVQKGGVIGFGFRGPGPCFGNWKPRPGVGVARLGKQLAPGSLPRVAAPKGAGVVCGCWTLNPESLHGPFSFFFFLCPSEVDQGNGNGELRQWILEIISF